MTAVQIRRAAAKAAGLCGTCCTGKPRPGTTTCDVCRERSHGKAVAIIATGFVRTSADRRADVLGSPIAHSRRRKLTAVAFTGQLRAPLLSTVPFDLAADRREEWLALSELSVMHRVGAA